MTAYRFWTLTCDSCGEIHDDGASMTVAAARAAAKAGGWAYDRERGDTCPLHNGYHRYGAHGYEKDA